MSLPFDIVTQVRAVDPEPFRSILVSSAICLLLSGAGAFTYGCVQKRERHTIGNLPYVMILFSIIVCGMMMAVGDSVARAFGLLGALSVLRFRLNIHNAMDMGAVLFALVVGIACGLGLHSLAAAFTLSSSLVLIALHVGHTLRFRARRIVHLRHPGNMRARVFLAELEARFGARARIHDIISAKGAGMWEVHLDFPNAARVEACASWLAGLADVGFSGNLHEFIIDITERSAPKPEAPAATGT